MSRFRLANLVLLFALAAAFGLFLSLFLGAQPAQAQAESGRSRSAEAPGADGFVPEAYEYVVEPNNNLTLLIRRSLQLYDLADGGVELSPAQTVYAETLVARDMAAPDLIYPGEERAVLAGLVARYARSSQDLTAAELAAWQVYADKAQFRLDGIDPANVTLDELGQPAPVDDDRQPAIPSAPTAADDEPTANDWYLWFVGVGTAFLLWYLFWRRPDRPERG